MEIASALSTELADHVYAGIKYPMEVGDSKAIKKEMRYIREKHRPSVFATD